MSTPNDTPFVLNENGAWDLHLTAHRRFVWGQYFDPERGFRVYLKFEDSPAVNVLSAEDAIRIADNNLDPANESHATFADNLRRIAREIDGLNRGWIAIGRPPTGFEGLQAGHA